MRKELIKEKFLDAIESIDIIAERFNQIKNPDDFVISTSGIEKLDSIAMRLQVIGELISKVYKNHPEIFSGFPTIVWKDIIGLRNIISHEYASLDHNIIYGVCKEHLPLLREALLKIIKSLD